MTSKANSKIKDKFGISPMDVVSTPGAISADEALRHFNVTQRPIRRIERVIHSELRTNDSQYGLIGGIVVLILQRLKMCGVV